MQIGFEKIDAPVFSAGNRKRVELPQTGVINRLVMRVLYGLTITGGDGSGEVFPDASHRIIDEFRVLAGKVPLQAVKAQTLRIVSRFLGDLEEYQQTPPTTDAAGAVTDREAWIELMQFMPHSFTPHSFGLPTAALAVKPVLEVAFNGPDDLFDSDVDYTGIAFDDPSVELYMEQLDGLSQELGRSPQRMAAAFPPVLYNYYDFPVVASETAAKIRLNGIEPGDELRAVIVETFAGGDGGERYEYDSAVVEELRLEVDDRDRYGVIPFIAVQQRNKRVYGLEALEPGVALLDAAENQQTGSGQLWRRNSRSAPPVLHLKTVKQPGDNLVRVTTISVRR